MEFLGCLSSANLSSAKLCSGGVSPARGAARGAACVRDGAGTGPCSPATSLGREQDPCHPGELCQAGSVLPIPAQPVPAAPGKCRQPVLNQRWAKTIGSRRLRSLGTCPSWGSTPEAARCIPDVRARWRAWERPQQSGVPRPRASPAPAARRGARPFLQAEVIFGVLFPIRLARNPQILHFFQCLHVQNLPVKDSLFWRDVCGCVKGNPHRRDGQAT